MNSTRQQAVEKQFQFATRGNQHDKRNEYVERSQRLKAEFEAKKKKIKDDTRFVCGLSASELKEIEQKQQTKHQQWIDTINKSITNTDVHTLISSAKSMFSDIDPFSQFNQSSLKPLSGATECIYSYDDTIVEMTIKRALSTSIKCELIISTTQPHFTKADNFEQTKEVIQTTKDVVITRNIKPHYGDYLTFMRSLSSQLGSIIKELDIIDPNKSQSINEDIWSFNF